MEEQEDRNCCCRKMLGVGEGEDKHHYHHHHHRKKLAREEEEEHLVFVAVEEQEGNCYHKVIAEAEGMGCYDCFHPHKEIEKQEQEGKSCCYHTMVAEVDNQDVAEEGMHLYLVEVVEEGIQSLQDVMLEVVVVEENRTHRRQVEEEQVSPNVLIWCCDQCSN